MTSIQGLVLIFLFNFMSNILNLNDYYIFSWWAEQTVQQMKKKLNEKIKNLNKKD